MELWKPDNSPPLNPMTASLAANGASQEYHAEEAMDISIQQCKNHQNEIIVQRKNILQAAVPQPR